MFVDSMSSKEMLAEYMSDLPELQQKTLRFCWSQHVEKALRKNSKALEITFSRVFRTTRGNQYIGLMRYTRKGCKKQKDWEFCSFHIGLMKCSKGLCAVVPYTKSNKVVKFTPHFFKRYKERFSKVCDWRTRNELNKASKLHEIISIYMQRNLSIMWMETESTFKGKTCIFGPVEDGVALLEWDKKKRLLQANTFITEKMLDYTQLQMVALARLYPFLSESERKGYDSPDFISND